MDGANHSMVSEFVFLGITNSWEIQLLLFVFTSTFYVASMLGNSLIMLTVTSDPHLHSPMYFLLANLSLLDVGVCLITATKVIYDILRKLKAISLFMLLGAQKWCCSLPWPLTDTWPNVGLTIT